MNGRNYRIHLRPQGTSPNEVNLALYAYGAVPSNILRIQVHIQFFFQTIVVPEGIGFLETFKASPSLEFNSERLWNSDRSGSPYPTVWHVHVDYRETPQDKETYTIVLTDITDLESESELGGEATTGVVMVGGSVTGTLDVDGDVDWFRVTLESGKTYRVKVRGADSSGGTLADPFLRIVPNLDIDIPFIHGNDDKDATTKDSELTITVHNAGDYFVEVSTGGTGTGTYTVEVEEVTGMNAPENAPAEGAPRITGTASVGQTLSADTTGINDADGLETVTYSYQWLADDAEVSGATGATYTVVPGDVGNAIAVRVTFTDDAGNEESLTSEPTAEVEAAGLSVESATLDAAALTLTYNATLDDGVTLPVSVFSVSVNGASRSMSSVSVSGTAVTLTLASAAEAGDTVTVSYTRPDGPDFIRDTQGRSAASFSGLTVANNTAPPPLTASVHDVPESHDGSTAFTFELRFSETPADGFSYRTLRDHALEVSGGEATKARRLEPGKNLRWEITVEPSGNGDVTVNLPATTDCDDEGAVCTDDGRILSTPVELTVPGPDSQDRTQNTPARGAPAITGTARVGETLTAVTTEAEINDADGMQIAIFSYRWLADDAYINGATGSTYTLVDADEDKVIKVRVSFTDDAGNAESLTSAATAAVAARPNLPATGTPTISGTAQVEQTLTAGTSGIGDADGLTNVSYSHQWVRNDGTSDADISGATSASYTLVAADQGKTIKVRVTFADDRGHQETLTSAATAAVAAAPSPLTASVLSAPQSHDGSAAFTFELRFSEAPADGFSYKTLRDHAFTVTGGEVTKARRLEPGKNLRWEIAVQPSGNDAVTVVLPVTEDCEADGAICTGDGRMLSSRLEFTVTGPGG